MRATAAILIGSVVFCLALPAAAQGRSAVRLSSPNSVRVGESSVTNFTSFSSGASQLRGSVGGSGMLSSGKFGVGRSSSGGASPFASYSSPLGETRSGMMLKNTGPRLAIDSSQATGIADFIGTGGPAGSASMLLPQESLLAVQTQAIVSLAPDGSSAYADCMREGERSFREQKYVTAFAKFEMAYNIGNDAESLISMAHTKFAGGSYSSSAFYLRQALRRLPQLPQINIMPRDFYSDRTVYLRDIARLREYIAAHPGDAEANLVYAYFAWFDPAMGAKEAQRAVTDGLSRPNPPQATQALEMFQESMRASVRYSAAPTTTPATAATP